MTGPTMIQVLKSVLAAFIGVQSEENRQKDFAQGSLKFYILGGVIFTAVFVALIIFVVSAILG